MNSSQGKKAVDSGSNFKQVIEKSMENHGFYKIQYKHYCIDPLSYTKVLVLKHPYVNAHGKWSTSGYTLKVSETEQYRINCMYQDVSGTAIQKVNFVLDSMQDMCDNIFVYSGKAFDDDIVSRINEKAQTINRNISVMSCGEFLTWLNDRFLRGHYVYSK